MTTKFLRLNGWRLPILEGSAARSHEALGELRSSWGSRPNRRRQAIARSWAGRASPLEAADADTLEALLEGQGHRWGFERTLFASSGLGPEAGYTFSSANYNFVRTSGRNPKPPVSYALGMFGGNGLVFDAELCADRWTVAYWTAPAADGPWTHKVARSDLARWEDGERNDLLLVDGEILVEDGALAIGDFNVAGTYIADLVLLPFVASADFVAGLYRWLVADGVRHWWRFDGNGHEEFARSNSLQDVAVGGATYPVSPLGLGRYLELNGSTGYVDSDHFEINDWFSGTEFLSISAWIRCDGPFAVGDNHTVVSMTSGSSSFLFRVAVTPLGAVTVTTEEAAAAGVIAVTSGTQVVPFGEWAHIAVSVDTTTDEILAWVNGAPVSLSSPGRAIGPYSILLNDLEFGRNNFAGAEFFDGGIDEFRIFDLRLSTEAVAEAYECGLRGSAELGRPRGFSNLPRVELQGAFDDNGLPVEVIGAPPAQTYIQHASKTGAGWRNNSREIAVAFDEVEPAGGLSLPVRPTAAVLLDDRETYDEILTDRTAQIGDLPILNDVASFRPFPFTTADRPFQVRLFGSAVTDLTGVWAGLFEGATQASVVGFARRSSTGNIDTLIQLEIGANLAHLSLQIDAANRLYFGGRSQTGDGFQNVIGGFSYTDTASDAYICLGGSLDFVSGTVVGGGVREKTSGGIRTATLESEFITNPGAAFGNTRWRDSSTDLRIGQDVGGGNPWAGEIAYVALIRNYVLTEDDLRQFFRAFRAGIFR